MAEDAWNYLQPLNRCYRKHPIAPYFLITFLRNRSMPNPFKPSIKEQLVSIGGSGEILLGGAFVLGLLLFLAISSVFDLSFIKSWQYEFGNNEYLRFILVSIFVVCVVVFALLYIIFWRYRWAFGFLVAENQNNGQPLASSLSCSPCISLLARCRVLPCWAKSVAHFVCSIPLHLVSCTSPTALFRQCTAAHASNPQLA